jgi:hypothetical protein
VLAIFFRLFITPNMAEKAWKCCGKKDENP